MLDVRVAQTTLEDALRDAILYALGARLPPVASVAELRAVSSKGAATSARNDDDLIAVVTQAGKTSYRWSSTSTAGDTGGSVIKPDDVSVPGPGRWLAWTSPMLLTRSVGGESQPLDQFTSGPLRRVLVIDKALSEEEINALLAGANPAVWIEAKSDDPEEMTFPAGSRWDVTYTFTISIVDQNLRDRREAAQGSSIGSEFQLGANALDGLIWSLLAGTQLSRVVDGVRGVSPGRGGNWVSHYGQRRVVREREWRITATVELPNAPNELTVAEAIDLQANLVSANERREYDEENLLLFGVTVETGGGLSRTVAPGEAIVRGLVVAYAGELVTFPAYSDTYRDLLPDGTMVFSSTPAGGEPPVVPPGALRVGVTTTSGYNVVGDAILAATKQPFGPRYEVSLV